MSKMNYFKKILINIPPITKEMQNPPKKNNKQTNKTYTDLNI